MKESEIEGRLRDGVKRLGGKAFKFVSPGNAGVPDRLVVLPGGKIIFAELKTDTGKVSTIQSYQIRSLQQLGADVWVVRGLDGVRAFLEHCRQEVNQSEVCTAQLPEIRH